MSWRLFRAYVRLAREDQRANAGPGDAAYDPDHPELRDGRFGKPPPDDVMRHIPWEKGHEPTEAQ